MELVIFAVQIIQIVVSILLILVILLQPGKSGDLGSIFGGGTSESVFGAAGAVPFLAKLTRGLAVLFMVSSLTLGYFAAKGVSKSVVTDGSPQGFEQMVPFDDKPEDGAALPADEGSETTTGEGAENAATGEGESKLESEATSPEAQGTAETPPAEGEGSNEPGAEDSTQ